MSLMSAIHGAMSGLRAASRGTEIVSENIANAMNEDYARRSLNLGASALAGPGVRVLGVTRHIDPVMLAGRRTAQASLAEQTVVADFWVEAQRLVGAPDSEISLASQMNAFESAIISAASLPESTPRHDVLAQAAARLAGAIRDASHGVQDMRHRADREISLKVDQLNTALQDVGRLNRQIVHASVSGASIEALTDQRQARIDAVNEIVPVTVMERDHGTVALISNGGAMLLDMTAREIDFTPVNLATPYMTQDNGQLSGLTLAGSDIPSGPGRHALPDGELAGLFAVRDQLGVQMQEDLDIIARDLVERFQDPTLDGTIAATDPGLFADDDARFDAANTEGLAYRLTVNELVDPDRSAETWRLRDGLGAAAPGSSGTAALLNAYVQALDAQRAPFAASFGTASENAAGFMEVLLTRVGAQVTATEAERSFAATSSAELTRLTYEQGVDTDAELQRLMALEKTYTANAKLIEVADSLLDRLLRI